MKMGEIQHLGESLEVNPFSLDDVSSELIKREMRN